MFLCASLAEKVGSRLDAVNSCTRILPECRALSRATRCKQIVRRHVRQISRLDPDGGANADFTDVFTGAPVRLNVMILNRVTTTKSRDGGKT
jgi:hypothetical protein